MDRDQLVYFRALLPSKYSAGQLEYTGTSCKLAVEAICVAGCPVDLVPWPLHDGCVWKPYRKADLTQSGDSHDERWKQSSRSMKPEDRLLGPTNERTRPQLWSWQLPVVALLSDELQRYQVDNSDNSTAGRLHINNKDDIFMLPYLIRSYFDSHNLYYTTSCITVQAVLPSSILLSI